MAKRTLGGRITILVFFGIFLAMGLAAIYLSASGAYYGSRAELWPSTEGRIEESRTETRMRRKGKRRTRLHLSYSYAVDGIRYANDRARFLEDLSTLIGFRTVVLQNREEFLRATDWIRAFFDPARTAFLEFECNGLVSIIVKPAGSERPSSPRR